jgi:hypothetical protein
MGSYTKFGTGSQGDTYTLSATQDGNNVDILLDAGSGTDSTVQLTAGNNITLTRSSAQEVEIAASGGGGGTVTVEKNVYTGNGSNTTFNTSTAIVNENNVQVYIDGVYQSKDNYTTSGSTVTFSTAPPNTTSVELIHMVSVDGVIARDSFTGNGSTTAYVLSMSISNENATQVYIDGVYQSKDNYTTSGSTLTFSTAPPNGAAVEVVHIKAVTASTLNQNNFTGDGSTTAFTLSQTVTDETNTFVFIQGVYQEKSVYSISGTTLTFTTAPQNGYTVEVMAFGTITVGNQTVTSVNGQTGAVTLETGTDWQSTIQTSNFTAVAGKGYFVNTTSASVTVTLPAGTVGDEIVFQDYAGTFATNKLILSPNGSEKIQGNNTQNGQINTNNATTSIVYQDATKGWTAQNVTLIPNSIVASGGTETTSGGKKYHTFLSSGTLNITQAGDYEYLIVAGGGGGGFDGGGGGGAGGLLQSSGTITSTGNYTITVGAGGTGASGYNITPATGNNSTISKSGFTTITANGGGGASRVNSSGYTVVAASNGGSGGGGMSSNSNQASSGGSGIAGQGNDGGDGLAGAVWKGAGGGGAGAAGANSATNAGGNGGDGLQYSTWATATSTGVNSGYYAGGGGGACESTGTRGSGGNGGGGSGGASGGGYTAVAGTANTGGGGGGGDAANDPGKAGGSGIIIIRYSI